MTIRHPEISTGLPNDNLMGPPKDNLTALDCRLDDNLGGLDCHRRDNLDR